MSGGAAGSGAFEFDVPALEEFFRANWGFDGTWQGAPARFQTKGKVYAVPGPGEALTLRLFGLLSVTTGSDVLRGPANVKAKVHLGAVPDCS